RAVAREFQYPAAYDPHRLRSLHRLLCTRSHNLGMLSPLMQRALTHAKRNGRDNIERLVWDAPWWGYWVKRKILLLTVPKPEFHRLAPPRSEIFADLYDRVANRYLARGQTALSVEMWEHARPPENIDADNNVSQALLRLPGATGETLACFQKKWVERHLGDPPYVDPVSRRTSTAGRKIRIGYHCSFMTSDTIRSMMRDVMAAHDRSKFEIYGYSVGVPPDDIAAAFDVVRDISIPKPKPGSARIHIYNLMPDDDFVEVVRRDRIDVFVELTGFSPGHRFGAMSQRCAPVQVSFLNHPGPSQVPNVDYILADEIALPTNSAEEETYSEAIYRLPGCFFCFDYRRSPAPAIVDPPSATRGYVTFGCFGTATKFNRDLIELWSQLLHKVPNAFLRLQNSQLTERNYRRYLRQRFEDFGIDGRRIVLSRGSSRDALLEVYGAVDVSLDTYPYCGGNTIAESFWMGVPVVTLRG